MKNEDYIDSINLDMKSIEDIEHLLVEYEEGQISRQEYLALTLLSHSRSYSKGFTSGFEHTRLEVSDDININITKRRNEISKILYGNSTDDSECIRIKFENIQNVIDLLNNLYH